MTTAGLTAGVINFVAMVDLRLGSCDHLQVLSALTCANRQGRASWGPTSFTVAPRCFPLDLVRLWCGSGATLSGLRVPTTSATCP